MPIRDRDDDDLPYFVIETRGGGGDVGAFLLGALVGAAAALLLAPRSGADTQAGIAGAVRRVRDEVQGRVGDARDGVVGRVESTRGGITRRIDSVRGAVETRVDRARAAVEAGRTAARDAREELQRRVEEAKLAYRSGTGARPGGEGEGDGAGANGAGGVDVVVHDTREEPGGDDLA